jgi:Transposase DNA-binding
MTSTIRAWAEEQFGMAALGDARRTRPLLEMAEAVARRPAGRVSAAFMQSREREGAYDFFESPHASRDPLAESMFRSTAERAGGEGAV